MERGFQMGGRGGIIDVSYLKPSRTKRILETFPQRGEPRGSSSVQRGAAGEEGRRESRNIGGEGCALSAGWKTMEFDEACQLTISMVVDRVNLGQRDYFFRKEERRACSTDSFQFERKPSSNNPAARMWRGLDDSRRATKLIHDILYYYERSRSTPSMIRIPAEPSPRPLCRKGRGVSREMELRRLLQSRWTNRRKRTRPRNRIRSNSNKITATVARESQIANEKRYSVFRSMI